VQALKNEAITIYGNGSQTRSFCYVDDLIGGMINLMQSDKSITGPINIGNPTEFTMLELAELVIKLTSSRSKLKFSPLPEDDPKQRQPNISLAKSKLNWEPQVSIEDGLKETIRYFRKILNK
jgi:UDP-glucuronate decarboxylase